MVGLLSAPHNELAIVAVAEGSEEPVTGRYQIRVTAMVTARQRGVRVDLDDEKKITT